jgi:hypothetical protein
MASGAAKSRAPSKKPRTTRPRPGTRARAEGQSTYSLGRAWPPDSPPPLVPTSSTAPVPQHAYVRRSEGLDIPGWTALPGSVTLLVTLRG